MFTFHHFKQVPKELQCLTFDWPLHLYGLWHIDLNFYYLITRGDIKDLLWKCLKSFKSILRTTHWPDYQQLKAFICPIPCEHNKSTKGFIARPYSWRKAEGFISQTGLQPSYIADRPTFWATKLNLQLYRSDRTFMSGRCGDTKKLRGEFKILKVQLISFKPDIISHPDYAICAFRIKTVAGTFVLTRQFTIITMMNYDIN